MASMCFVKKRTLWELKELLPLTPQSTGTYANLLWDPTDRKTEDRIFLT